jgi:hypothetical protein
MARIVYSGLIDNIRGSIGGTTFQNNKHGFTVKRKPNIVKPVRTLQNARKVTFSSAVKAWQALTSSQRSDWNSWAVTYPQYAKNNPTSQLTGYEVFVRNHAYIFMIGESVITAPVYSSDTVPSITLEIGLDTGVLYINTTSVPASGDFWVLVSASRPLSVTQNFVGSKTRYFYFFVNDDDSQIITTLYQSKFGIIPSIGDRVALSYVLVSTSNGQFVTRASDVYTVQDLS